MRISQEQVRLLIEAARQARSHAYAPFSQFAVGAAIMDVSGRIHSGCNVENASFGLTLCAERVALCSAVAQGQQRFRALALATSGGHAPCGACRQVLAEFCRDLPIWLVDIEKAGSVEQMSLESLLPQRFEIS